ncbi:MAG: hypothetical protein ACI83W_001784 [Marinoscillum sp.]|jgi:hypothetical protein
MKRLLSISLILLVLSSAYSQQNLPQEEVFLQVNSNFLLVGEMLYFSAFANAVATGDPSDLSSILYVELIGKNDKIIFQQKIALSEGRGNGSYFLSSLIPTGTYQVVAYTRWMKNFGNYFQSKIQIINPFESYETPTVEEGLSINWYPESGIIRSEVENLLVFKAESGGKPFTTKGRLVDDLGNKISDLQTNVEGLGRVLFKPKNDRKYQAILENTDGNFTFHELPEIQEEGALIQVRKTSKHITIQSLYTGAEDAVLRITDGYAILKEWNMASGEVVFLETSALEKTGLQATLGINGKLVAQRNLYPSNPEEVNPKDALPTYGSRTLVELPLNIPVGSNISVSVFKSENENLGAATFSKFRQFTNSWELNDYQTWESLDSRIITEKWKYPILEQPISDVTYLPELRGELLKGQIVPPDAVLENSLVIFSISGAQYQVNSGNVDEDGTFLIQHPALYGNHTGYLAAKDVGESARFVEESPFLTDYPPFEYEEIIIDSARLASIVKRSLLVQIENAYFRPSDSTFTTLPLSQFGPYRAFYKLDDFNRFPRMYEHFIEFIPEVLARENKQGMRLKPLMLYPFAEKYDPLILLDGVPVSEEEILNYSPFKVESIGVINNRIFLGPLIADGLVSFHSFDNNLLGFTTNSSTKKIDYQGLSEATPFAAPDYSSSKLDRLPDYRHQLLWNPNMKITSENQVISFFTSDTKGKFVMQIDGFSDGKPIHLIQEFIVD